MRRYLTLLRWGFLALALVRCGADPDPPAIEQPPVLPRVSASSTATVSVAQRAGGSAWAAETLPTQTAIPEPVESVSASVAPVPVVAAVDYAIQPGDTLLGIAMQYGIPVAALQLQNDLGGSTTLRAGDRLLIPPSAGWEGASVFWVAYEVAAGDTLSGIATAYGVSPAQVQKTNGLADADLLAVGQVLVLPVDAPLEPSGMAEQAPEPTAVMPAASDVPVEPTAAATVAGAAAVVDPPSDVSALAQAIFALINGERAAYGLPALTWNGILATAAQLHAQDCYERGWCSHTGSDGSTMKDRIIRQGYEPVRWSECWAWYGTPETAVAMWMDEVPPDDPHRRTLLSSYLTEVGVGVMPGNGHGYYFIADFGTPAQ